MSIKQIKLTLGLGSSRDEFFVMNGRVGESR